MYSDKTNCSNEGEVNKAIIYFMPTLNIGLTDEQRHGVIELLNRDLADSYLLLIKTKKYHWDKEIVQAQKLNLQSTPSQ